MPRDPDKYDFFVSYARADNADGWITAFVDELLVEHRKFAGDRELIPFFDTQDILSLDDWQHRLHHGLAASRLFLAFISPNYFASEWCRGEWRMWIDLEIAKHVLSSGAAPVYIVEVPGLLSDVDEQDVARRVAELCDPPGAREQFLQSAASLVHQFRRRQLNSVEAFYRKGLHALRQVDLREVLNRLAHNLDDRANKVRRAAESETTVPPYNKQFSGRLDELLDLRERLKDDRTGVICGVHGLGGVGKTELAFTYAHAFAGAYPGGRFLVPCEGKSNLREAVLYLGELFSSDIDDEQRMTTESYFEAITGCLRQRLNRLGHILLVLDNVTDSELLHAQQTDLLTSLGPTLHLLATTRLPSAGGPNWLTLGELPEADALDLLRKYRPFERGHRSQKSGYAGAVTTVALSESEAAHRIVSRLGGFALAVELVGAWMAAHPEVSYLGFLDRLGKEQLETLDTLAEDADTELRRHNHERQLTFVLGPTLAELSDAERMMIEFAALLPPDHVPLPWLRKLVGQDYPDVVQRPESGHPDPWDALCRRLLGLALFSRADGQGNKPRIVRIHRLVQEVVRRGKMRSKRTFEANRQGSNENREIHQEIREVDQLFWEVDQSSWEAEQSLESLKKSLRELVITKLAMERIDELEGTTDWREALWEIESLDALANYWSDNPEADGVWLLTIVGIRWRDLAQWTRSESLLRRALEIDEQSYGADHREVATDLGNLALVLKDTNRLAEAECLFRRALEIDEKSYGVDHPEVASDLNSLATLLKETNRLAEAERLYRRALAIDEKSYGVDHPKVAADLNSLAALLKETNRLAEAEPLYRRALEIDEQSHGADHPRVATRLNNLALFLENTNRLTEAESLYRRALAIDEQSYGVDHPNLCTNLDNLARLLKDMNRFEEAESLFRRALDIDETSYGADHPKIAGDLNSLATLLEETNLLAEAEPLYRRALEIDERSYGPGHPSVATRLNNLALLLENTNQLTEAESLYRRSLTIDEQSYGIDHPKLCTKLDNLAGLLKDMDRHKEAESLFRRALDIDETSYGLDHPKVAGDLTSLAMLLKETNRLAESEPLYRRALGIDEQSYGPDHPNVAIRLNNLARLLKDMDQLAEAEPLYRRALRIDEQSYGPNHPSVAARLNNLAVLLENTNRLTEAESLYRRALKIDEQSYGPNHPSVAARLNNLALLLENTNRLTEAETLYRRALAIEEESFGEEHPKVAIRLNNLAWLLEDRYRPADAEILYQRAIAILKEYRRNTGHDHPESWMIQKNLVRLKSEWRTLRGLGVSIFMNGLELAFYILFVIWIAWHAWRLF